MCCCNSSTVPVDSLLEHDLTIHPPRYVRWHLRRTWTFRTTYIGSSYCPRIDVYACDVWPIDRNSTTACICRRLRATTDFIVLVIKSFLLTRLRNLKFQLCSSHLRLKLRSHRIRCRAPPRGRRVASFSLQYAATCRTTGGANGTWPIVHVQFGRPRAFNHCIKPPTAMVSWQTLFCCLPD